MSAPHVAGVVALYMEDGGNDTPGSIASEIQAKAVQGIISGTNGSPNLLLQSTSTDDDGPLPPSPPWKHQPT